MKHLICYITLLLFAISASAQTSVNIEVQKNSTLDIHGSTNVIAFKLEQSGDKFILKSNKVTTRIVQNRLFLSNDNNEITINVNQFTSSNKMALRDFKKLVKSDKYPTLQVKINYLEMVSSTDNLQTVKGNASVIIILTGVSKQYFFPVIAIREGNTLTIKGEKKLSIRDFGLEPPTQMLGMIKVDEWINIGFNLICKVSFI